MAPSTPPLAPMSSAVPTDRSLLRLLRDGSEAAAGQLYLRYAQRLYNLILSRRTADLARCEDADDIVQSVFGSFFRRVRKGYYDVPAGEELWKLLLVMALNKIRAQGTYHRAAKRDVRLTATADAVDGNRPRSQDDPEHALLRLVVEEALEQLDQRQREIVRLRLHGHEVAEIAELTGRSKRTVERNLQSARSKLSRLLERDA